MTSLRKIAIAVGVLFLVTDISSIAAVIAYAAVLNDPRFIISEGPDTGVFIGAFLEVVLALGVIGTAVALYPVVRRQNDAIALGYVGLRVLEAGIIVAGIVSLLAIVTLRQQSAEVSGNVALGIGRALVSFHNWTFLLGPGFTSGANTVLIAYLLYRSRLVPSFIPVLGLVGGPLVFASATAVLFGAYPQYSALPAVLALPEFFWELSLAVYLIARGFRPSALAAGNLAVGASV